MLATVSWLGIERCDLVGASSGAGVAVETNVACWVDGRDRGAGEVEEDEVDQPPLERLGEVTAPTVVLLGGLVST